MTNIRNEKLIISFFAHTAVTDDLKAVSQEVKIRPRILQGPILVS